MVGKYIRKEPKVFAPKGLFKFQQSTIRKLQQGILINIQDGHKPTTFPIVNSRRWQI